MKEIENLTYLPSDLKVQQPDILAPEYAGSEFIIEEE